MDKSPVKTEGLILQISDIIDIAVIAVLAVGGAAAGVYFSRRKYWAVYFCISFLLYLTILIINRTPSFYYQLPFSWFFKGRGEYLFFSLSLPVMFGTLIPRLKASRQRLMVWGLAAVGTGYFGAIPVVQTLLVRERLNGLETWREDGVCLQTTDFTCGPASAVTALEKLGIEAEESALALAAYTTPSWGTSSGQLAQAIETLYGRQGVRCRIMRFDSIEQLRGICPVIATVEYRFMVDHYVTVLDVEEDTVLVGDPLKGQERLSFEAFEEKWRRVGILVNREQIEKAVPLQ